MIFDAEDYHLLHLYNQTIPAKSVLILSLADQKLITKQGHKKETFPSLSNAWFEYCLEEWNLSAVSELMIGSATFTVKSDNNYFRPRLDGQNVSGSLRAMGSPELFASVPEICIPLSPQRNAHTEAMCWRVNICQGMERHPRSLFWQKKISGAENFITTPIRHEQFNNIHDGRLRCFSAPYS